MCAGMGGYSVTGLSGGRVLTGPEVEDGVGGGVTKMGAWGRNDTLVPLVGVGVGS